MISKNLLTYTTLQRLETISSTLLQCIQRTLDERTLGIIFRAEVLQKKKKKKIWWRRTRQISNSGEEKLEGFLSLPLTVFLYLQRSEKKRAHTPRWTQGMKVVRVTYFPISLVCQRHQRVWRVAGILRTGRGAGWGRRTRRPGFKSVSM